MRGEAMPGAAEITTEAYRETPGETANYPFWEAKGCAGNTCNIWNGASQGVEKYVPWSRSLAEKSWAI